MVFMIAELNPFVPSCINLVLSTHLCMYRIIKVAAVEILTQLIFHYFSPPRYSDRVKAETERLDQIEFDDLEVVYLFCLFMSD